MGTHVIRRAGYRAVLRVREFQALLTALTVSMTGTVLASLALAVLVFERTQSPLLSALTFAVGFIPFLLGGTLLAGLVDRVPPRALMTACDMMRAAILAAMALLSLPVWALLALLFVTGLITPVFAGAQAAVLPDVLDDGDGYVLGRSLLRIVSQTTQILGYAVGGSLLLLLAPRHMLLANALTFVCSAVLIRLGTTRRPARTSGRQERVVWQGLAHLRNDPALRRLLAFHALVPAFAVVPEALAVPYVVGLGRPAAAAGLLLWALPAGTITGQLAGAYLPDHLRRRLIVPLAAVIALAQVAFVFRPGIAGSAALLVVSGMGFAYTLGLDAVLLDRMPEHMRGRLLAVASAAPMFSQGVGMAVAGAAAELIAPATVIWAGACVALVLAVAIGPRATTVRRLGSQPAA